MVAIKIKPSLFAHSPTTVDSLLSFFASPLVFSSLFPDVKHCAMTAAALGTMTKKFQGVSGIEASAALALLLGFFPELFT